MRYLIFAIVFLVGCAGRQKCCPPFPPYEPPPPPAPIMLPQDTYIPPVRNKVQKCLKFIVSENYPYNQGPDLRCEMSLKW